MWGLGADGSKHKHYYVRESVGIAVGLLITALHAGLATLTHAPSPMGFLKEILAVRRTKAVPAPSRRLPGRGGIRARARQEASRGDRHVV